MGTLSSDRAQYPILNLTVGGEAIEVCDTTRGRQYLPVVALRVATAKNPTYFCILSDGECINCCVKRAMSSNIRPALVIANIGNNDYELSV